MAQATIDHLYEAETDRVHYAGPFLVGWTTLCGIVEPTKQGYSMPVSTDKPVTCRACLAVVKFVRIIIKKEG